MSEAKAAVAVPHDTELDNELLVVGWLPSDMEVAEGTEPRDVECLAGYRAVSEEAMVGDDLYCLLGVVAVAVLEGVHLGRIFLGDMGAPY